jgi:hypothetical protein
MDRRFGAVSSHMEMPRCCSVNNTYSLLSYHLLCIQRPSGGRMATYFGQPAQERPLTWNKAVGRFVSTAGPVQVDEHRAGGSDTKVRPRRSRFLKGPVPWNWIVQASELPGKALIVGLCLWRLRGAVGNDTVMLGNVELEPLGIDRAAKSRALAALERAGLVTIERNLGRLPMVTLRSSGGLSQSPEPDHAKP